MTVETHERTGSSLTVQIVPDENDLHCWTMLAMLSDYLWRNFGLELDCEVVEVRLVYGDAEETAQRSPQVPES